MSKRGEICSDFPYLFEERNNYYSIGIRRVSVMELIWLLNRKGRFGGEQVQDVPGSACSGDSELR